MARQNPDPDVFLRLRLPEDLAAGFIGAVESARRRLAGQVGQIPRGQDWPQRDCPVSVRIARDFFGRGRRSPAWVGLLALLEDFTATWDAAVPGRARRRAAIFIRDGWRCAPPGCTSRSNLQEHHYEHRSRGGSQEEWNKGCLCAFHHLRGEHGDLASCRGRAPLEILWTLGRDGIGGTYINERAKE